MPLLQSLNKPGLPFVGVVLRRRAPFSDWVGNPKGEPPFWEVPLGHIPIWWLKVHAKCESVKGLLLLSPEIGFTHRRL